MTRFEEKPVIADYWINAGFFVFEPEVFVRHRGQNLESDILPEVAKLNQLFAYRHTGFWKSMDTSKDQQELESINNGHSALAPWNRFEEVCRGQAAGRLRRTNTECSRQRSGWIGRFLSRVGRVFGRLGSAKAGGYGRADCCSSSRRQPGRHVLRRSAFFPRHLCVRKAGRRSLIKRSFAEYGIDTVFHLAAQPLVGVAKLDPIGTLEANVVGTWNVLEAARQTKVNQVVVASSDKAYGESADLPYTETHPLQGKYPYDCSKSCADLISQMYLATYDLPVSVIRCANLFGGGDLNFSRTIPGVIRATLENKPFVIRSDGQFVRDFLYVKDAADCYLFLAESARQGAPTRCVQFQPGSPMDGASMRESRSRVDGADRSGTGDSESGQRRDPRAIYELLQSTRVASVDSGVYYVGRAGRDHRVVSTVVRAEAEALAGAAVA